MRPVLPLAIVLSLLFSPRISVAAPGTEWVLVLDNSGSMAAGSILKKPDGSEVRLPPSDPSRLSVLATLIFRALLDPAADHMTILTFKGAGSYNEIAPDPNAIRSLVFDRSTPFSGPFRHARELLQASLRAERILLLVTDGTPSEDDPLTPKQARQILGLDPGPPGYELVPLGLAGSSEMRDAQRDFLGALGPLRGINSPGELVTAFTDVFAASIRSRPQTGRLDARGSFSFPVGRYVTQVLVGMASEERGGPIAASLTEDGRAVTPSLSEAGDNGCSALPCHHYQVLKAPHDPDHAARMTLHLDSATGSVGYGIILRYELGAEIVRSPSRARLGEEVEVIARMTWRGHTFDDAAFFAADGFAATLEMGDEKDGEKIPLVRRADGTFAGRFRLKTPGARRMRARFSNQWLNLAASSEIVGEGYLPLVLRVQPNPVDFGAWQGARLATQRCVDLDFSGSENAERVPLEVLAEGLPDGLVLDGDGTLAVANGKGRVCVRARSCCGAAETATGAVLRIRGRDSFYRSVGAGDVTLPVRAHVEKTTFLACWWRLIAAITTGLLLLWLLVGFLRPHDFAVDEVIRLAKTEAALARASARRLRDLPNGRRGFYRDARVAFDGGGNTVLKIRGATLVLRAARGEPLVTLGATVETKDPRTHKWQPVPPNVDGAGASIRTGLVYRAGDFFFKRG